MQFFDPSLQDRVHGAVGAASASGGDPLLSAPSTILWLVFIGAILIFLIIIYLIMRGRVIAAAHEAKAAEAKFFHPAGENADISFEGDPVQQQLAEDEQAFDNDQGSLEDDLAEVVFDGRSQEDQSNADEEVSASPAKSSNRGAFAGLFSRSKKEPVPQEIEDDLPEEIDAELVDQPETLGFSAEISDPSEDAKAIAAKAEQDAALLKQRANEEANDIKRRAEAEAQRLAAQAETEAARKAAEAEQEAARQTAEQERMAAEREAEFERRKQALRDQQKLADETKTSDLSSELDHRFAELSKKLEQKIESDRSTSAASPVFLAGQGSPAVAPADTALMAQQLTDHRQSVDAALSDISARVDKLAQSPASMEALRSDMADLRSLLAGRTPTPSAPIVQLADIVRNALPSEAFEMNVILPNNRKADCFVRLPYPPGPIAIDAKFPIEAYQKLHQLLLDKQSDKFAEDEFRRVALRHIIDIAERMIIPDHTADSALMFVPSESIYAEFHARFPDIIQDSYRARVWIVSPSTLMATLNTVRAIVRDAYARENANFIKAEAAEVMGEVENLRQRVANLEDTFDRTRSDVRDVVSSTDQVYRRAETITRSGRSLDADPNAAPQKTISAPPEPRTENFYTSRPQQPTIQGAPTTPTQRPQPSSQSPSISPGSSTTQNDDVREPRPPEFPLR